MYCKNCGNYIDDNADVCIHCGVATDKKNANDSGSAGWGVLGFFFPIVGLILFLVWHSSKPKSAKSAGIGTLIGVIVEVVFGIIYAVAIGSVIGSMMTLGTVAAVPLI